MKEFMKGTSLWLNYRLRQIGINHTKVIQYDNFHKGYRKLLNKAMMYLAVKTKIH